MKEYMYLNIGLIENHFNFISNSLLYYFGI